MNRSSILRFLLLGCIWGSSYTFIKVSLEGLTPGQLVLARLLLGTVVLLSVVALRKVRLPSFGAAWAHITVTAILGMVAPFFLLAWGERSTSAAMAGVLIGATPLLTLALATAVLPTERATVRRTVGMVLGFGGVILVISPWQSDAGSLAGQLAVLGAATSYAAQTVYVRWFLSRRGFAPLASAAAQLLAATVLQIALIPATGWETPSFSPSVLASILLLGIIGTAVGYLLYFRLIGDVGATTASAVNYLVPITAVLIGVVTLGDAVTWNMALGTVIVLLSLAFAEGRLSPSFLGQRGLAEAKDLTH